MKWWGLTQHWHHWIWNVNIFRKEWKKGRIIILDDLPGNKIGVEGAEKVSKILQVNTTLTSLNLSGEEGGINSAGERIW